MKNSTCVAFIPARSGSKRIPNKNIKKLGSHPLIAYTITIAKQAKLFSDIYVSTDSPKIAEIARYYGASVPFLRPTSLATDTSPDIDWLSYILNRLKIQNDYFSILRPTSPFRRVVMIKQAWKKLTEVNVADSIRAVDLCFQHPAKMWTIEGGFMKPVLSGTNKNGVEWHSMPKQSLPNIYAQNASLEIAKVSVSLKSTSISGKKIIPFITSGYDGYDLNSEKDWIYAEYLIREKKVNLPKIDIKPYEE